MLERPGFTEHCLVFGLFGPAHSISLLTPAIVAQASLSALTQSLISLSSPGHFTVDIQHTQNTEETKNSPLYCTLFAKVFSVKMLHRLSCCFVEFTTTAAFM